MKLFVFANKNIDKDNGLIQKNEVGIVENQSETEYLVDCFCFKK